MNTRETATVLQSLFTAYPRFYSGADAPDKKDVLRLWSVMFKDDNAASVMAAVKAYIATDVSGFPPHIGAIKNAIVKTATAGDLDEVEAWNLIRKAICNSGYHSAAEFKALPPILQKVVGGPEQLRAWGNLTEGLDTVVASNVRKSYRIIKARQREILALPADVRKALGLEVDDGYLLE